MTEIIVGQCLKQTICRGREI